MSMFAPYLEMLDREPVAPISPADYRAECKRWWEAAADFQKDGDGEMVEHCLAKAKRYSALLRVLEWAESPHRKRWAA